MRDPRSEAVIEPGADIVLPGGDASGDGVEMLEQRPERVRIAVHSASAALLVLSDPYYPGWKATVDGAPARIVRTNVALRGVRVGPGSHEVVFTYEPAWFGLGAAISAAALCALAILAGIGGRLRFAPGPTVASAT